ncbi:DMT family transporter [Antarcticimicrobium luteum]|uniref:DMT family transporter n=1 Tax=Antarcticimicrobium luteum TaxID=2547397 RepID=A0A4R5UQG1_9RHOB|nr:DMT family transporter [Antarcticimicrobium luteum]TDK41284.1 DMT family transporter [Antarcticimicrobium luteum]
MTRLALPVALAMAAFAANSLLNRAAVDSGAIGPAAFAAVRVLAGAAMLGVLVLIRRQALPLWHRRRWAGALSLTAYMVGFSAAYLTLDAGLGALILFGVVQITMFAFGALGGARPSGRQLAGAGVAFAGLAWILWPAGGARVPLSGALWMVAAGIGWGVYTLSGRGEPAALAATAANFCLALPLTALPLLWVRDAAPMTVPGVALAALAGAVTSGLGYALWYALVPRMTPATAATVQLSVPVIALAAGAALLGEAPGWRLILGAAVVLGGIALALPRPRPARG